MSITPIDNSHVVNQLEFEMRDLLTGLYRDYIQTEIDDINVYGAPHQGSFALIERLIDQEGLTVMRETAEENIRYLFNAWRNRNPQRGLHFLRTYLTSLFGQDVIAEQLWQLKAATYPTHLRTMTEIQAAGENVSDYFLTSRVRVEVITEILPENVASSLRAAVAARILLNIRIGQRTMTQLGFGQACSLVSVLRLSDFAIYDTLPHSMLVVINEDSFVVEE